MIRPFFLLIHFAAKLPPVQPGRPELCPGRNCESVNKNPVELNLCIVQTNSDLQGSCSLDLIRVIKTQIMFVLLISSSRHYQPDTRPGLPLLAPGPAEAEGGEL